MPGRAQTTLLACLCAAVLGGCDSGDGTIPSEHSSNLITLLDAVEGDVASGDCALAQDHAQEFTGAVNLLPAEVGTEVKGGLQQAATRLTELTNDPSQCEQTTGDSGVDGIEPAETTTTTEPPLTTETTTTTDEETTLEEPEEGDEGEGEEGGGPPEVPPGQDGAPPGQDESDGPTSGGIGGERRGHG